MDVRPVVGWQFLALCGLQRQEIIIDYSSLELYFGGRVIKCRRIRWAGHLVKIKEGRRAFKILTSKPTGKRPLGKPRRRCEDSIKIDLKVIGGNTGNWIGLAQDRNYY